MEDWLLIQNFYHGLTPLDRSHLDAAASGAFFSLNVTDAKALIEKMVSNQGWNDERLQPHKRGMHSLKEADMIATKMDLLAKRLENCEKMSNQEIVQVLESRMTCEVCGESGHSGQHCPETHEDLNFDNHDNIFRPQNLGWNQRFNNQGNNFNNNYPQRPNNQGNTYPSLKDLLCSQGRMTESINKRLHANDKMLETINAKLEDFSSAMMNQLSFNKMLETQLAQLVAIVPSFERGRIPGQPEATIETANLVTARYDTVLYSGALKGNSSVEHVNIIKRGDPSIPAIHCSIGDHAFHNAMCDLGSSINIMSKSKYEELTYRPLAPTPMYVQLADQSV
jgi:hypothetical protein